MATSGSQRQPSAFQNIKLFPDTQTINSALWILKKDNTDSYITPANNVNVLIKKNLIVNGSIVNPSDLLLKENIISLRQDNSYDSIDTILKLNPVKYNYISDENKLNWIDVIDDIIYNYNHSKNRGIGIEPYRVNNAIETIIVNSKRNETEKLKEKVPDEFKVGDSVRVLRKKKTYEDKLMNK
jgi:hypothetical protein